MFKDRDQEDGKSKTYVISFDQLDIRTNSFDVPEYQVLDKYDFENNQFWDKNTWWVINKPAKIEVHNK